jgi:LPXTG-motif cell wall-anchored protein
MSVIKSHINIYQEEQMKKTKKIFAAVLTLAMMLVFIPTTALAETEPEIAMVSISNNTFAGGDWTGDYLSAIVELTPGMTMGDAVKAACDEAGVSVTGATAAEGGFISDIDGLSTGDAGGWSGWMFTVNNWFNTMGLNELVEDGDWISVQYSVDGMGGDLGSIFFPTEDANNKTLQALEFDYGTIEPAFDPDTHDYKLTLPAGTDTLFVLPLAFNLNYQVRTSVDGTVYKLMDGVPVAEGTVITIVCGDPSWPSMNNGTYGTGAEDVAAETYTVTIAMEAAVDNGGIDENGEPEVVVTQDNSPETGDSNTMLLLSMIASISALAAAGVVMTARKKAKQ